MTSKPRGGHRHHKDLQLSRQVFDALSYALAELDDPVIDQLVLAAVTPAPSSARVLITLVPARDDIDHDLALAHMRDVIDASRRGRRGDHEEARTRAGVPHR